MPQRSRLCPSCGRLNSAGEARCFYCSKRLPGPVSSTLLDAYRSVFGGELAMTRILIAMNVVVFGLCVALDQRFPVASELLPSIDSSRFRFSTLLRMGALPGELLGLFIGPIQVEPWRYLSAIFLHASVLHLVFNMLAVSSFGGVLERHLGSARYAVLFFVTGIVGYMVSDYWGDYPLTLGASGSAFGLLGARIGVLYARRDPGWKDELIRNAVLAAILALAMRVNTAAHLGGAAAGVVLGLVFEKAPRQARLTPLFAAMAVLGLVSTVGSIVLSNKSRMWRDMRAIEMNVYQP